MRCLRAVGLMEERLRNACNASAATFESVIEVCYWLNPFDCSFFCVHHELICHSIILFPRVLTEASLFEVLDEMVAVYEVQAGFAPRK